MPSNWREEIVAEALTWKGTPFHSKARIKGVGVDCGGIIYESFKKVLGIPRESFPTYYAEDWAMHRDNNEIYLAFLQPYVVPVPFLRLADVCMFKFGRAFSHGSIYIGQGRFIHAYGKTEVGAVIVSREALFNIGLSGEKRERKLFGLDERWLS